ncbi:MAG TPA: maltose alpha-D-glucosyltransferase [Dehalococcoidia bacterium]|nr:maltose alpha-D-glucosyltransferase [Dehalococcoidia bacterium]
MARSHNGNAPSGDPHWYKDAVIYEVHVRAFYDSNDDGIGDFAGLTQKLDYLKDLGVTAIWLLPFYPSPLLDDGYDIADYTDVHESYGSLRDARIFIREAHARGLRVITELVCNHTSDEHPWFQRARRAAPGSSARNFYVWSDNPDRYKEARIIFKDFESSNWSHDPVAGAYYWHRFYRHQPDLNFDNPRVREAIIRVMDFWLEMGVDGLRLDAIPYLYERDGTSCENLPETYEFLRQLRAHIDENFEGRLLLAEANQWPEDAVAYFGDGDLCQMAYHFPLMPRLFMSIHMEDRFPIVDIVRQTPQIPENCQWAVFLRNHDELTLEMVTDEERDYMYRVYASDQRMRINLGIRRRLAPLLGNHRRRIELMNGLLFSMPGTPVLYYGDEIGMGDNVYLGDRNGVRTPMQWSADRNAGFSRANPQRLYLPAIIDPEYHYETVNVEAQNQNPHSLLWWTKRLIALRKRYKAFGRGSLDFLQPDNRRVLAFMRRFKDERILVVANLSRFVQGVNIDLSEFKGMVPVEMFGRIEMPPIGESPYFLTLGPHSFYWLALEPQRVAPGQIAPASGGDAVVHSVPRRWQDLLRDENGESALAAGLPGFLAAQRWFAGKGRRMRSVSIEDAAPVGREAPHAYLVLLNVQYSEGPGETYLLPIAYESGKQAFQRIASSPGAVLLRVRTESTGEEGVLFDASVDEGFATALLNMIERRQRLRSARGVLAGIRTPVFRRLAGEGRLRPSLLRADQSNTSINYQDKLLLKLFRKLEPGLNPDYELGRFLTQRQFPNAPQVAGAIEYHAPGQEPTTLAVLHQFIRKEGDAWQYTLNALRDFFDRALALTETMQPPAITAPSLLRLTEEEVPTLASELIDAYTEAARLLGVRTAEMHAALSVGAEHPDFAPEPYTPHYQRAMYQSMRNLTTNALALLDQRVKDDPTAPAAAADVLALEEQVLARFRRLTGRTLASKRIRGHGDLHLGQVLSTGNDFIFTDFEGEPARSLSERRLKRSPLRDVAGMLRSFSYAVHTVLRELEQSGLNDADAMANARAWGQYWQAWVSAIYLGAYLEAAGAAGALTADYSEIEMLLGVFLLEKAVYELGYELNNRPDWLIVPLEGILDLLEAQPAS